MEQVPSGIPEQVRAYLFRQLNRLEKLFLEKDLIGGLTALPTKPVIGKLYYFKNTIGATITAEGVWVYKSTGWSYLG